MCPQDSCVTTVNFREPSVYSLYVLKTLSILGRKLSKRPNHPGTEWSAHTIWLGIQRLCFQTSPGTPSVKLTVTSKFSEIQHCKGYVRVCWDYAQGTYNVVMLALISDSISPNIAHSASESHSSRLLVFITALKSRMAEWLEWASYWHEMCCHDLEVMGSNPRGWTWGALCFCLSCT